MIAEHEAEIVGNALRLRQVPLSDVMTPRTVVGKVAAGTRCGTSPAATRPRRTPA